jgi:mannose-1-phosphate guanylyltransferase
MTIKILPVLMCGGSGKRLWPLSTEAEPKQFHALATERTMLQDTALRVKGLENAQAQVLAPVAICGLRHAGIVEAQLTEAGTPPLSILLEPVARNTAAVATLAALIGREIDPARSYCCCRPTMSCATRAPSRRPRSRRPAARTNGS